MTLDPTQPPRSSPRSPCSSTCSSRTSSSRCSRSTTRRVATTTRWQRVLDRGVDQPVRRAGHLRVARACSLQIGLIASLVGDRPRHDDRVRPGRYRFRGRSATNLLIFMPMATPEVVMGSSLLTLFLMMGVPAGRTAILIAHIMFCVSFVVVAVKARVATLDPRLEEAAADLGANPTADLPAGHLAAGGSRHRRRCAARVLAQLRRLHHHQLQREPELDHVPHVRLGRAQRGRAGAGQRHRHGHVPARPGRSS